MSIWNLFKKSANATISAETTTLEECLVAQPAAVEAPEPVVETVEAPALSVVETLKSAIEADLQVKADAEAYAAAAEEDAKAISDYVDSEMAAKAAEESLMISLAEELRLTREGLKEAQKRAMQANARRDSYARQAKDVLVKRQVELDKLGADLLAEFGL